MLADHDRVRFWGHVRKTSKCWLWQSTLSKKGYGAFGLGPRTAHKVLAAHRVAWRLTHGDIPMGLQVCHSCDRPSCVRPDHLFVGTAADNSRDMMQKGRDQRNGAKWNARLTAKQVRQIHRATDRQEDTALRFGISSSMVAMIQTGRTWRHLGLPPRYRGNYRKLSASLAQEVRESTGAYALVARQYGISYSYCWRLRNGQR